MSSSPLSTVSVADPVPEDMPSLPTKRNRNARAVPTSTGKDAKQVRTTLPPLREPKVWHRTKSTTFLRQMETVLANILEVVEASENTTHEVPIPPLYTNGLKWVSQVSLRTPADRDDVIQLLYVCMEKLETMFAAAGAENDIIHDEGRILAAVGTLKSVLTDGINQTWTDVAASLRVLHAAISDVLWAPSQEAPFSEQGSNADAAELESLMSESDGSAFSMSDSELSEAETVETTDDELVPDVLSEGVVSDAEEVVQE